MWCISQGTCIYNLPSKPYLLLLTQLLTVWRPYMDTRWLHVPSGVHKHYQRALNPVAHLFLYWQLMYKEGLNCWSSSSYMCWMSDLMCPGLALVWPNGHCGKHYSWGTPTSGVTHQVPQAGVTSLVSRVSIWQYNTWRARLVCQSLTHQREHEAHSSYLLLHSHHDNLHNILCCCKKHHHSMMIMQ